MAAQLNYNALVGILSGCIEVNETARKLSEERLSVASRDPGYAIGCLQVIAQHSDQGVKAMAAVALKNFINRSYENVSEENRVVLRSNIVGVMLSSPANIRRSLSVTIATMGTSDFVEKWPTLCLDLVKRIHDSPSNLDVLEGVCRILVSLFKRYVDVDRSDDLFTEIKLVIEQFGPTLLGLMEHLVGVQQKTPEVYILLRLLAKCFFALNWQDLPAFFEDNVGKFMKIHQFILGFRRGADDDDDEAGPVEKLQTCCVKNLTFYMTRYEPEFEPFVHTSMESIWRLLGDTNLNGAFDRLSMWCLDFLSSVAKSAQYAIFGEGTVIEDIFARVLIPSLEIRESDTEMFEDDPYFYARQHMTVGGDGETRSRAAQDLIRALGKSYESRVVRLCSDQLNILFGNESTWEAKTAGLRLFTAFASKGYTQALGTTVVVEGIDVLQVAKTFVFPILESESSTLQLVSGAIKFAFDFRCQLVADVPTAERLLLILCKWLLCQNVVVQSFAIHTIGSVLVVRDTSKHYVVSIATVRGIAEGLMRGCFLMLERSDILNSDYVLRGLTRFIRRLEYDDVAKIYESLVMKLIEKLAACVANPSNPLFIHFLFEVFGSMVGKLSKSKSAEISEFLEQSLLPPFQQVLSVDAPDFEPYIFQIYAQLIEVRPGNDFPSTFQSLLDTVVSPSLWMGNKGNYPALVGILQAFLKRNPKFIVTNGYVQKILDIFVNLLKSKLTDHHAFHLLETMTEILSPEELDIFVPNVLWKIMDRLQRNLTNKLKRHVTIYLSLLVVKCGVGWTKKHIESVQNGLFSMICEKIWIPFASQLVHMSVVDRKTGILGLVKLLSDNDSPAAIIHQNLLTAASIESLVQLLQGTPPVVTDQNGGDEDEDLPDGNASFSLLSSATTRGEHDVLEHIPLPMIPEFMRNGLDKTGIMASNVPDERKKLLLEYMNN